MKLVKLFAVVVLAIMLCTLAARADELSELEAIHSLVYDIKLSFSNFQQILEALLFWTISVAALVCCLCTLHRPWWLCVLLSFTLGSADLRADEDSYVYVNGGTLASVAGVDVVGAVTQVGEVFVVDNLLNVVKVQKIEETIQGHGLLYEGSGDGIIEGWRVNQQQNRAWYMDQRNDLETDDHGKEWGGKAWQVVSGDQDVWIPDENYAGGGYFVEYKPWLPKGYDPFDLPGERMISVHKGLSSESGEWGSVYREADRSSAFLDHWDDSVFKAEHGIPDGNGGFDYYKFSVFKDVNNNSIADFLSQSYVNTNTGSYTDLRGGLMTYQAGSNPDPSTDPTNSRYDATSPDHEDDSTEQDWHSGIEHLSADADTVAEDTADAHQYLDTVTAQVVTKISALPDLFDSAWEGIKNLTWPSLPQHPGVITVDLGPLGQVPFDDNKFHVAKEASHMVMTFCAWAGAVLCCYNLVSDTAGTH